MNFLKRLADSCCFPLKINLKIPLRIFVYETLSILFRLLCRKRSAKIIAFTFSAKFFWLFSRNFFCGNHRPKPDQAHFTFAFLSKRVQR